MRDKKGRFKKGERASPETEFKKGQHWREHKPYWDHDWLFEEYVTKQKSAAQIAQEQECGENNIFYFLHKYEIPVRSISEARAVKYWGLSGDINGMYGRTGTDNPNWRGGCSPERQALYSSQEWTTAVKIVWARDKASCQRCGTKKQADDIFHIHHIVSFSAAELRAEPENLMLVCATCHHWIHSNANIHKEYMRERR